MPRSFDGPKAKIKWAHKHLKMLDASIRTFESWFEETQPYLISSKPRRKVNNYDLFLDLPEPVPHPDLIEQWGLQIGDVVHNARSALDQVIEQLTREFSNESLSGTDFPIFRNCHRYGKLDKVFAPAPRSGYSKLRGIDPSIEPLIESYQPYHRRNDEARHPLNVLNELWNEDKHRVIPVVGAARSTRGMGFGYVSGSFSVSKSDFTFSGPLKDGAKIGKGVFNRPEPHKNVKMQLTARITFEVGGPGLGEPVIALLYECVCAAAGVTYAVEGA